jgi:hypothetical protein
MNNKIINNNNNHIKKSIAVEVFDSEDYGDVSN